MKHPIRATLQRLDYIRRPFGYWLAPTLSLAASVATAYAAVHVKLSEKLQPYSVFFLILAFLFTAFFLLITLPCVAYGGYQCVMAMKKQKRFVLPAVMLALDAAVVAAWVWALLKFIL